MTKRLDAPDTVDAAIHLLAKLQAEGWVLGNIEHAVEYGTTHKSDRKLPVAATVHIRLLPVR